MSLWLQEAILFEQSWKSKRGQSLIKRLIFPVYLATVVSFLRKWCSGRYKVVPFMELVSFSDTQLTTNLHKFAKRKEQQKTLCGARSCFLRSYLLVRRNQEATFSWPLQFWTTRSCRVCSSTPKEGPSLAHGVQQTQQLAAS